MTAAVQIALAIMTIYFIIANIRKPMTAICEGIELFRPAASIPASVWTALMSGSTIEQALNRASAALLSSQSALEAKVTELQKEIEARQRAEAEAPCWKNSFAMRKDGRQSVPLPEGLRTISTICLPPLSDTAIWQYCGFLPKIRCRITCARS